jgi:hypothetical protein
MFTKNEWIIDRPSFEYLLDKKELIGVEIGVEAGENAFNILTYLDIKKLYLIDLYIPYNNLQGSGVFDTVEHANEYHEKAINLLSNFKNKIEWIIDFSEIAVNKFEDNSLDFVYIDGCHLYDYVKKDIELYYPKVKIGGILSGHDYKSGESGVIKAVNEFNDKNNLKYTQKYWDYWWIK